MKPVIKNQTVNPILNPSAIELKYKLAKKSVDKTRLKSTMTILNELYESHIKPNKVFKITNITPETKIILCIN
jgi:hypothetical protein